MGGWTKLQDYMEGRAHIPNPAIDRLGRMALGAIQDETPAYPDAKSAGLSDAPAEESADPMDVVGPGEAMAIGKGLAAKAGAAKFGPLMAALAGSLKRGAVKEGETLAAREGLNMAELPRQVRAVNMG